MMPTPHEPLLPDWRPLLSEAPAGLDLTWAYEWPAGRRMAAELSALVPLAGKNVAELGCGRGRCGLTALLAGAAQVLFADGAAEPLLAVNAAMITNGVADRGRTAVHRWGEPLPEAPYDVLLGADILYRPDCQAALLDSLAASLHPTGLALLADPRQRLEADLPALAHDRGLIWHTERRQDYTLVRVMKTPATTSHGTA